MWPFSECDGSITLGGKASLTLASPGGGGGGDGLRLLQIVLHFSSSRSRSRDNITAERLPCFEAMEPTGLTLGFLGKITNNFSEERVIGRGGYGKVYRGLRDDGQEIAVKLLFNNMQTIDDVQFKREFENLMMLKHPNIVRLVGYCYETQHQHTEVEGRIVFSEETHKALCFEYMPMGSLKNHLSDECSGLDWKTRYRIIKGACEGLKYLHEDLENPFYHLDLKPDNILLDENMAPKLADFGLSKFYGEEQTRMTHTCIGTLGYLPPEYLFRRVVSKKLDIFSLGVVMTKIIAGPIGPTRYDEMQQEFLDQVQGNWTKRLQASSPETLEAQCQQVRRCTEVALSCMDMDRHKRPSIVDIIHELDKTELFGEMATYCAEDPSPPLNRGSGRRRLPPLASTSKVVQPKASPSPPSLPPTPTPSAIGFSAPLDGFLKIREGVYVLNSCFNPDALTGNKCQRQRYIKDIALSLKSNFVDVRLLVYNFGVVYRSRSLVHDILARYDITVTRYPSQYEGCAVPVMGMIHTFLCEMDDGLFREQVFVMHFEPGGWPVLAFLLAGLLLYQQKCTGEQKTLEMIYKKAPRELTQCLSPLNHMPSQIRYLQYISRSKISTIRGTPADPPLVLDYVVLRSIPNFYAEAGCCLIFRIYGMDPLFRISTETKELFSTSKKYELAENGVIKIEVNCNIEGDVVLECTCMYAEKEREEMMFHVMFNTSFIISDILMLGRDEIDMMWDAKDRFPEDFKAEVIFSEVTTKVQHTFSSTVCSDAEAEV